VYALKNLSRSRSGPSCFLGFGREEKSKRSSFSLIRDLNGSRERLRKSKTISTETRFLRGGVFIQ
jgi:hypothetical protein